MKFLAILYSAKQFLTGLVLKSISDDVQTAVALNRADRLRQLEEQAGRDRDAGNTTTAALLEASATRLTGGEQCDEGFEFLTDLVDRSDVPLTLSDHNSVSNGEAATRPHAVPNRRGRPSKPKRDHNPGS